MSSSGRTKSSLFSMLHFSTALFYLLVGAVVFLGLHLSWIYIYPFVPAESENMIKLLYDITYLAIGLSIAWVYLRHHQKFQEQQTSEERLRLFIKHAPVAVAMLDTDMRYIETSDRWIKDYHLEGIEIRNQCHYDVFSFIEFTEELLQMHKRCLQGETLRRVNVQFTSYYGAKEWVNYEMAPWRHVNGTIGGIIFFSENITEKKEAEKKLEESESRFIRALNGSRDIVWDLNIEKKEIYFHPRLKALLGYPEQSLGLAVADWKKIIHPQDYQNVKAKLAEHLATHHPFNAEYRIRSQSGQYYWFEARGQAEWDESGEAKRMSGFLTDISDKKHLENIKKEFVYVVTHELRTPLTALKGAIDMLPILLGKDIPQRVENMLDLAMQGSERLMCLINDLLTAGEMESETMRFDMQECRVSDLIEQAEKSNSSYGQQYKVGLRVDDKSEEAIIMVDHKRFQQIMSNLLSNAIKFSPEESNIFITATKDHDHVRIAITDHGAGIPENFRSQIFQKFVQHDKSKPGTGLGLNITKTMVERMNGTIDFDSVEGKGTTFFIKFPLTDESA